MNEDRAENGDDPAKLADSGGVDASDRPACPWCGGTDLETFSVFGPSLMTRSYRCRSCTQDFEAVRWR